MTTRCSHGSACEDFKVLTRFRQTDWIVSLSSTREERNLRVSTIARHSACSAEEAGTSSANPSIRVPAESRHTQAIDPSSDLGCNFGSGRCLLKTKLFLAFQISQRTTETISKPGASQTSLVHLQRRSKCSEVSTCARHIGHIGSVVLKELAIQSIRTRGLGDSKLESCLFNLIHRYFYKQPKLCKAAAVLVILLERPSVADIEEFHALLITPLHSSSSSQNASK
ncbi:uncharacterized protein LOC130137446 [Syzygium oleosum]|uniref:uncharacterized protein LOC130137446 n=1 Tax=Syzygium oleosum TaxID=219896 RepID=UPI0024BA8D91|nr:uncharacterized protein LOC130137446 [Syzygium oleosum]